MLLKAQRRTTTPIAFMDLPSQRPAMDDLVQNIRNRKSTLVLGERGIGKTLLAHAVADKLQRPFEVFHFSGVFDPEASITGAMRLIDGRTVFVTSRFVEAITKPGTIVVLDEINRAPITALNALFSLTDDQGRLSLDLADQSQRIVTLAPDVVFVATANIGPEYIGVEPMDAALMDRMTYLRLSYPRDEDRLLVPCGVSKSMARKLVKLATAIREQHGRAALPCTISTRGLVYTAKLVAQGTPIIRAFERNVAALDEEALSALRATLKAAS